MKLQYVIIFRRQVMNDSNVENIAKIGSVEDVRNLLRSHGRKKYRYGRIRLRYLDDICRVVPFDKDETRRAAKIALVAAYTARGNKALNERTLDPRLQTLRQIAFESASGVIIDLLKEQGEDKQAVEAIVEGVHRDHGGRFFNRGTKYDRARRKEKRSILGEFYARAGLFAPDALDDKMRIAELTDQVAALQRAAGQLPAGAAKPSI
jgi:hypothetical protein